MGVWRWEEWWEKTGRRVGVVDPRHAGLVQHPTYQYCRNGQADPEVHMETEGTHMLDLYLNISWPLPLL